MAISQPNMPASVPATITFGSFPDWIANRILSPRAVSVLTKPKSGVDNADWFGGDQSNIFAQTFTIESSANVSDTTSNYFNWELNPHLSNFWVKSGYSGFTTMTTGTNNSGQKIVNVRNNTDLAVGMKILINGDPYTVATKVSNNRITTTTNLINTYSAGTFVTKGNRTFFSDYFSQLFHIAGGDAYSYMSRVVAGKAPDTDQSHYSYNSTAGWGGGDLTGVVDGVYLSGIELNFLDSNYQGSHDICVVGDIRSFQRTNDTGAYSNVWVGALYKSEGTKYAESCLVVSGKWKGGLDTILADLGTSQAAIKLGPSQRIYFDGSGSPDAAGYRVWGQNAGDSYIHYNGGLTQMESIVDGASALSWTATNFYFSGQANIAVNKMLNLNNGLTNTGLVYDGTNIKLYKAGVVVATW